LVPEERASLLERFPPRWPDVIADHVTFASRVEPEPALPTAVSGEIIGRVDDGAGIEAMIVRIGDTTDRPDGSTWHITWSLDRQAGRRAVESNDIIARLPWTPIEPMTVTLVPAVLKVSS